MVVRKNEWCGEHTEAFGACEEKKITVGKGNNRYLLEMLNICQEYLEGKITCFFALKTLFLKISNFYNIEVGNSF